MTTGGLKVVIGDAIGRKVQIVPVGVTGLDLVVIGRRTASDRGQLKMLGRPCGIVGRGRDLVWLIDPWKCLGCEDGRSKPR